MDIEIGFDQKLTEIAQKGIHSYSTVLSVYEQIGNYEDIEQVLEYLSDFDNYRIAIGFYYLSKARKGELDFNDERVDNWRILPTTTTKELLNVNL